MANEFKKVILLLASLGLILGGWSFFSHSPKMTMDPGTNGPLDFSMRNTVQEVHRLREFRGYWVLLNFWAPWCDACIEEFPHLKALEQKMGKEPFRVVCVSTEPIPSDSPFLDSAKFPTLLFSLERLEVLNQLGVEALPTSFLVSPTGEITETLIGFHDWTDKALLDRFSRLFRK